MPKPIEPHEPQKVAWNGEKLWAISDARPMYRDAHGDWCVSPVLPPVPKPKPNQEN